MFGIRGGPARVFVRPLAVVQEEDEEFEEGDEDELDEFDEDEDELEEEDEDLEEDELDEDELEEEEEDEAELEADEGLEEELEEEEEDLGPPRRVRAPRSEAVEAAVDILQQMLDYMGLDATVEARPPQTLGDGIGLVEAVLDVTGDELGLLIGRRGETLASLQYILNLVVRRRTHSHLTFGVDVEGYRRRREVMLNGLARRMADRVRATGQSLTLEPMPPAERRIVHLALANDPDVLTVSIGEGDARKVAITPRH